MSDPGHGLAVTHAGGARFRIEVRGHELFVDQPVAAGGDDSAPTPTDLFVASIAACAAYYGRTYLERRGLPDRVDVRARWVIAPKPTHVAKVSLEVEAPGVPADRMDVFRRVLESCLVHNTLTEGCDVQIEYRSGSSGATTSTG